MMGEPRQRFGSAPLKVLDRLKLVDVAGGSFGTPEQEFPKNIGLRIRRL
jgi:hypothetical protein